MDRVTSSPQVSGWSVGLLSSPLGLGHPQGESRRPSGLFLRRGFVTLGIPRRWGQRTHWAWGQVGRGRGKQSVCPRDEGQGATGRVGSGSARCSLLPWPWNPRPAPPWGTGSHRDIFSRPLQIEGNPDNVSCSGSYEFKFQGFSCVWDYIFPSHFWC